MAKFYAVNPSTRENPTTVATGVRPLGPGQSIRFDKPTPELVWADEDGQIEVYDTETDLLADLSDYTIIETLVPLDPKIAEKLPPDQRQPTVEYTVLDPIGDDDLLDNYMPSSALRTIIEDEYGAFRAQDLMRFPRLLDIEGRGVVDGRGLGLAFTTTGIRASGNNITQIDSIARLGNAKIIDFTGNSLTELPGLSLARDLIELRLSGNQLTKLESLRYHRDLDYLDVRDNLLTSEALAKVISDLWAQRYKLGDKNAILRLEGNEGVVDGPALDMIKGTGIYQKEGLEALGCVVTYDAAA